VTAGPPDAADELAMIACRTCGVTVPLAGYCGACGAHLNDGGSARPSRPHSYAASPAEHVLQMSLVSSLFPHLPHRSRAPFRAGLAVLGIALIVLSLLRLQACVVAVSAVGVPLLFVLYLQESDVYDNVPVRALLATTAGGAALGIGWNVLDRDWATIPARDLLLGTLPAGDLLRVGVLLPAASAVLMLVPVGVARLLRPPQSESLDGFLIGAVSALAFTTGATFTRLSSQLYGGLRASGRTASSVLIEALLQGAALPVAAAAAGSLVGATLWVRRRRDAVHGWRLASHATPALVLTVAAWVGLGLLDVHTVSDVVVLVVHAAVALVLVVALRIGLHAVLLHEEQEVAVGPARVCPHCEHVVPSMPFCPHCGVAARAASHRHRRALALVGTPAVPDTGSEELS
jgi:hypothetical protein